MCQTLRTIARAVKYQVVIPVGRWALTQLITQPSVLQKINVYARTASQHLARSVQVMGPKSVLAVTLGSTSLQTRAHVLVRY